VSTTATGAAALGEAVELARDWADPVAVERAETAVAGARDRDAVYERFVVAALAGGTGSGKSSLFNALIGDEISVVGVKRPTTSRTLSFSLAPADQVAGLLDHLQIDSRAHAARSELPEELVVLDLPDHDSDEVTHRLELDRLIDKVDVFIWVVDPEKYADTSLHDGYLRPLADHAGTFIVALNQVDLVSGDDRAEILADLTDLLRHAGLARAKVIPTSALTGEGVPQLRAELERRVSSGSAAREKLAADLASAAGALTEACGAAVDLDLDEPALAERVAAAVGAAEVERAAGANYADDAASHLSWFGRSWWRRGWSGMRRRMHLGGASPAPRWAAENVRVSPVRGGAAVQAQAIALEPLTDLELILPPAWAGRARADAERRAADLPAELDEALVGLDFSYSRPRWWRPWTWLQNLLGAIAVAGALWLLALLALALLRLPEPPLPTVGEVPWPTLMLIAPIVLGGLLGLIGNRLARLGRRRQRARAGAAVREAVRGVVAERVVAPMRGHGERQRAIRAALERVRPATSGR
jgi:GTP-binding protein EngB required for normal cell division